MTDIHALCWAMELRLRCVQAQRQGRITEAWQVNALSVEAYRRLEHEEKQAYREVFSG